VQALATANVALLMPHDEDVKAVSSKVAPLSDPFKFFDNLRLQLRGVADALDCAVPDGSHVQQGPVQTRVRALLLTVSLLLDECRRLVRLPSMPFSLLLL
jgi:hypothetical protein